MSDISSIGFGPVGPLNQPGSSSSYHRNGTSSSTSSESSSSLGRDRVELSDHARLLDQLRNLPAIRSEKVDAVREAIANNTYETPDKLDVAVQNLLEDLF